MNKTEIQAALTAAGIEFDPNATVEQLKALAAEKGVSLVKTTAPAEKLVTVKANGPLMEAGERYEAGDRFDTTEARAAALGNTVTIG